MDDKYAQTFLCQCAYMANSGPELLYEESPSNLDGLDDVVGLLPAPYDLLGVEGEDYSPERLHNIIYFHVAPHLAFSPL